MIPVTSPPSLDLPPAFVRNVVGVHGKVGTDWLQALPALRSDVARRWDVDLVPQSFGLSFNYVVGGTRRSDGQPVVLKLGVPGHGFQHEIETLRAWDGRATTRVFETDPSRGALLIERVFPGTPLPASPDDATATTIAAHVMRSLRTPASNAHRDKLPAVADWVRGMEEHRNRFGGGTGPFPAVLFEQAENSFIELLHADPAAPIVLHGDLHHGNILAAGNGTYRAIDPKGIVGAPAFEPSAFMLSPTPQPREVLARRLDIFADILELDRERIRQWALARAVLSAAWGVSVNYAGWVDAITVAERLASLG